MRISFALFIILILNSGSSFAKTYYKPQLGGGWHGSVKGACDAHTSRQQQITETNSQYKCLNAFITPGGAAQYTLYAYFMEGGEERWAGSYTYSATQLECADNEKPDFATGACVGGQQNGGGSCDKDTGSGNPISHLVGNKTESRHDFSGSSEYTIPFTRYYNSKYPDATQSSNGIGSYWRHEFQYYLIVDNSNGNIWAELISKNARSILFTGANATEFNPKAGYKIERIYNEASDHTGWLITKGNETLLFNLDGYLTEKSELNSIKSLIFTYDDKNNLVEARQSDSVWLQFEYEEDTDELITKVTSSTGEFVEYTYDEYNNLISASYADDSSEIYHYDSPHGARLLTGITDRTGHKYVEWDYDDDRRATSSKYLTHAGNPVDHFTLDYSYLEDPLDPRVIQTNPLGKQTIFHWEKVDGIRRVKSVEGVATANCVGANRAYTYYPNGKIATKTDWKGNLTSYEYDSDGRETLRTVASGSSVEKQIATEWHSDFRSPLKITEGDKVTEYTYDDEGRILTKRIGELTPSTDDQIWTWTYTTQGKIETIDGPRIDLSDITTYTYDANGNISTISNALSHTTVFANHDAKGRARLITNENGLSQELVYNSLDKLESITQIHPTNTELNQATRFTYDAIGQLTLIEYPDGSTSRYEYDGARRLTALENNLGDRIEYTLDAAGNTTNENIVDASGNLHYTLTRNYDELNRLIEIQDADATSSFNYDLNDNLTSNVNGRNFTKSTEYDARDRLTKSIDPLLNETEFTYDEQGNLDSVKDARGLTTWYQYDIYGNQILLDSPDTGVATFTYDNAGNRLSVLDNNGIIATYTYDALNRLLTVSYPDDPTENIQYGYDDTADNNYGVGRLTSITDKSGQIHYKYDYAGQLREKHYDINGQAFTQSYTYDNKGRLSTHTYPGGRQLRYGYDALGRVTNLYTRENSTAAEQLVFSGAQYYPFGPLESFVYANGIQQHFEYDSRYRPTSIQSQGFAAANVFERTYDYDENGNIIFISNESGSSSDKTLNYDALDRLESAADFTNSYFYSYDAVGNRLSRQKNLGPQQTLETYTYESESNRLDNIAIQSPIGNQARNFIYDDNGNVVVDALTGALNSQTTIDYGENNRPELASVDGLSINYVHNSLGQRTVKSTASTVEKYHYDESGQLIAVSDAGGSMQQQFIYFGSMPVAVLIENPGAANLPIVSIESPEPSQELEQTVTTVFSAYAFDEVDGDISSSIVWESSLEGILGSGPSINIASLTLGEHLITARVQNSAGLHGLSAISVNSVPYEEPVGAEDDSDGDGLLDVWELQYFGVLDYTASDDVDLDGATNIEEFALETDPSLSEPYKMAVLADLPLAYWRLNEEAGSEFKDTTLNNHDAVISGTPQLNVEGALAEESDPAALFNQSNAYLDAGDLLGAPTELTFEVWAYLNSSGLNAMITHRHASNNLIQLKFQTNNEIRYQLRSSSSSLITLSHTAADFRNQWLHITATLDVANNIQELYVNGQLVDSKSIQFAGDFSANTLLVAAYDAGSGIGGHFGGRLDEVAIYPHKLSAEQIQNHYQTGIEILDSDDDGMPNSWELEFTLDPTDASDAAGDEDSDGYTNLQEYQRGSNPIFNEAYKNTILDSTPLAYWQFNEDAGSPIAVDSSGNGNDAMFENSPNLEFTGGINDPGNTAVDLNGTSQYIDAGSLLDNPQQASFEVWVNLSDAGRGMLLQHRSDTTELLQLYFFSESEIRMALRSSQDPIVVLSHQQSDFRNTWLHLVAVFDNINNEHVLYVNGVAVATDNTQLNGTFNATRFLIGDYYNTGSLYQLGGTLDEAAVYDRPLTALEVQAHYQAGVGN